MEQSKIFRPIPHEEVITIYNESMIGMTLLSYNTQVGDEGTLAIPRYSSLWKRIACNMFKNKIWKDIVENNKCEYR